MMNISTTSCGKIATLPSAGSPSAESAVSPAPGPSSPTMPAGELQALSLRPQAPGRTGAAMAPRSHVPLASTSAKPEISLNADISANQAKREMGRLLSEFESYRGAAREIINDLFTQEAMLNASLEAQAQAQTQTQTQTPAEKQKGLQEAMEKYATLNPFVLASQCILDYRASLPRHVAVRIAMSDSEVRNIRDNMTNASIVCKQFGSVIDNDMIDRLARDYRLIVEMTQRKDKEGRPLDVSKLFDRYHKTSDEFDAWRQQQVTREERTLSSLVNVCNLPGTQASVREAEEADIRRQAGQVVFWRASLLESKVDFGAFLLAARLNSFDAMQQEAFLDENGKLRLLVSFQQDIVPAFESVSSGIFKDTVDEETLIVLEGVVERLSEFASGLDDIVVKLRNHPAHDDLPLDLLDQMVEVAWMASNDALHTLDMHLKARQRAAEPPSAEESAKPAKAATPAGKKMKKPKPKSADSAAGSPGPAAPPRGQSAPNAGPRAASGKAIVRSDLGTLLLADAPMPASLPKAPPTEVLAQLDELVKYDLSAQQRKVSEAYQDLSPENARYVVENTIRNLTRQAPDMAACLAALEDRRWLQLGPAQLGDVHDKVRQLATLHADIQGVAKALQDGLAATTTDHMKRFPFPTETHIKHLLQAGELAPAGPPRALRSEPGTLFEVMLQPAPLRNGSMPRPFWLHVHTSKPVRADQLASLGDADFTASHVKSDAQRGYNRQWQNAKAAAGHQDVVIHRGKVAPALCRTLLTP